MKIETVKLDDIIPYESNPRIINDKAIKAVAASIREYGWQQPIVVDKDMVIIVGHTRRQAAIQLGLDEVPVHIANNLPDDKVKAYRLMDNKAGEFSEWDTDALQAELMQMDMGDLGEFFFDDLSRFDFDDLDDEDEDDDDNYNMGNPIIQYNIIFDDEDQQTKWHAFVRTLKVMYEDEESIAARLIKFIEDHA